MSQFLQDLLIKVKQGAEALDSPPAEPDNVSGSNFKEDQKQKKETKPGLPNNPYLDPPIQGEPGLVHKPRSLTKPGLILKPGLLTKSGLLPQQGQDTKPQGKSEPLLDRDPPTKPGLVSEPGSFTKPSLPNNQDLDPELQGKPGLPIKPGLFGQSDHTQHPVTFADFMATLNDVIPIVKGAEMRLYFYLIEQRFGNSRSPSDDIITYSQKSAMQATGIKSTATIVKSMTSLSKKKLVKWVRKSRKLGEVSQIRVFLLSNFQQLKNSF
jgi:hypothetical protein